MSTDHPRERRQCRNPYLCNADTHGHSPDDGVGYPDYARECVTCPNPAAAGSNACPDCLDGNTLPTHSGPHVCVVTARSDLRYLIQECSHLDESWTDEQLARQHDAIERAMVLIRDLPPSPVVSSPDPEGAIASGVAPDSDTAMEAHDD